MSDPSSPSFFSRHEFLIRRLHSLSGLFPVGGYMVIHLATNASVLAGPAVFQSNVDSIHKLGPLLPFVEWTFIFLPIIFHAVVGVLIMRNWKSNTTHYAYARNFRYTLQRVTAWIALLFIFWHVFHMHGWIHNDYWIDSIRPLGGASFNYEYASSTAAAALKSGVIIVLYVIGVLACVYHLANGLWTMGITWGAWTTPAAMRRADFVCMGFGAILAIVSMSALYGMVTVDPIEAKAIEQTRIDERRESIERAEKRASELRGDKSPVFTDQPVANPK